MEALRDRLELHEEFLRLEDKNKVFCEKPSEDLAIVNALEAL